MFTQHTKAGMLFTTTQALCQFTNSLCEYYCQQFISVKAYCWALPDVYECSDGLQMNLVDLDSYLAGNHHTSDYLYGLAFDLATFYDI